MATYKKVYLSKVSKVDVTVYGCQVDVWLKISDVRTECREIVCGSFLCNHHSHSSWIKTCEMASPRTRRKLNSIRTVEENHVSYYSVYMNIHMWGKIGSVIFFLFFRNVLSVARWTLSGSRWRMASGSAWSAPVSIVASECTCPSYDPWPWTSGRISNLRKWW